jgi:hypothetical protein
MDIFLFKRLLLRLIVLIFFIFSPFDLSPAHAVHIAGRYQALSQTIKRSTVLAYEKIKSEGQKRKNQETKDTTTTDRRPPKEDSNNKIVSPEKKNGDPQKENDKPSKDD